MESFPEDVRSFITEQIDTIELLETLLLVRHHPAKDWTAEAVSRELYTSHDASSRRLLQLTALHLVAQIEAPHMFRYSPASKDLQELVDRLDEAYRGRRVTVINLIYSKPASHAKPIIESRHLDQRPQ